jgi:predicted site-specific integrase-resolvase
VDDPHDLLVSAADAATVLGLPVTTVRRWARHGLIHPVAVAPVGARGRPVRVYRLGDVFTADRQSRQQAS